MGAKPLLIRFDKVDKFIKLYDGNRYLVIFDPEKCDAISNRVRYLVLSSISRYSINHNFPRIRID